ncbi:putative plastoquinol--plastocyanin reductase [Helianthus annuus]|uniref:plastoquinol--plastocyanin reductase n=1 Tax=Helianthus annuus TaxID=4232 RepID=A0A251SCU4_HELAN|nr:cytochrome b6-f complex iron-sulfur subunit, chloroplastic isoform X1 [Helianthus annuus]KAF5766625.1 putative plastoquinol--plastocyanin reductase [Helianthus annuus]KAJ0452979.1 putative plastoquinol--plastocyanin reductase [Helianthus annuus]KAJ0458051.1 putative plastoquinol--plastocyanin reductase [Helianthus annuus]KAJ0474895.1 putative plastoquinol--plastocyanin reductase [Helianthus annuus]KAJ0650450.1 putative plastoquinol--plastocyanin reductase [Helianthus annuus]
MAAFTLSPSTPALCSSKKKREFIGLSARSEAAEWERGTKLTCEAMGRRELMKLLMLGAVGLPAAGMQLLPYSGFCTPPVGGGIVAKDEDGKSIIALEWLNVHGPGDRTLTQGLKGDPTYLIVENKTSLATYGINAVCTHLGCIVPWNTVEKKFMCPCHGSQYNNNGTVIKGPAHLSLELANVDVEDDRVVFGPWTGTDFRTGDAPWWS